jgi:hypothetical protein
MFAPAGIFMKTDRLLALAALGAVLASGCTENKNSTVQAERPPAPPAAAPPAAAPRYELKNDEAAALRQFQDLMKYRRYEQAHQVAAQFAHTPGFKPLADIAKAQSETRPMRQLTAMGVTVDLNRFEQLRPMAMELRDPRIPPSVISSLLADPDSNSKLMGMALMMIRNDPGAAEAIQPLVNHQDFLVRAAAAFALAALRDPAAESALKRLTGQEAPDPLFLKAARFALEHIEMTTRPNRSAAEKEQSLMRSNELFRELMNDYDANRERYRPQLEALAREIMSQQQQLNPPLPPPAR